MQWLCNLGKDSCYRSSFSLLQDLSTAWAAEGWEKELPSATRMSYATRVSVESMISSAVMNKEQARAKILCFRNWAAPAASPWNPETLFRLITRKARDDRFWLRELVTEESIRV